jgi:hypothetical protein
MRFLLLVVLTLALAPRTARACDIDFFTPYDLHDRATTVVLIKVDKLAGSTGTANVIDTFKGVAGSTLTLEVDRESSCSTGMKVGQTGVVFLDEDGNMQGAYEGFERDAKVIDALRAYGASSADTRAKALHALAVSSDWSRSYEAAYALANRADLIVALDDKAKARVKARLAKVARKQHPLTFVAARLRGTLDAETDAAKLAATIASSKKISARITAMERCERVRGRSLAKYTDYASSSFEPDWKALAEACRTGKPI